MQTFSTDKDSNGHNTSGADVALEILRRLKAASVTTARVVNIVRMYDLHIEPDEVAVKKMLSKIGKETYFDLIAVRRADSAAQDLPSAAGDTEALNIAESMAREIIARGDCLSLADLAVKGEDILSLGVSPGKHVGELLNKALEAVISDRVRNDRTALLDFIAKYNRA